MNPEVLEKNRLSFRARLRKRIDHALGKKKLIIGLLLFGIVIGTVISLLLTKYYRADSKIFFVYNSVNNNLLSSPGSLDKEVNLFYNPQFTQNSLNKLKEKGFSISRSELSQAKEVMAEVGASAIQVEIVSEDPVLASEIANVLVDEFYETSIVKSQSNYINSLKVITERENALQEAINQDISQQESTLLSTLTLEEENLITQISEFESELESLELDNQIYNFEVKRLTQLVENSFPGISQELFFINNPKISGLIEKLERLEAVKSLSVLSKKLGGYNIQYLWPENYSLSESTSTKEEFYKELNAYLVRRYGESVNDKIEFLKSLMSKYYDASITVNGVDLTKSTIFNNLTVLETDFNRIPFDKIDEARKSRVKKFNNSLLIKIKTKKSLIKSSEEDYLADVDYINKSEVPETYFSPSFTQNILLGGLSGLIIGLLIAFSSNKQKIEVIESPDDVNEYGFKLLAQIPNFPAGSPILFDAAKKSDKKGEHSQILQSFSSIETFLKYGSLDNPLKSVLVTSSQQEEGKSVIASNIAIALAMSGNKVLLVDANLKYPVLYKFFKVKSTPSLAHFLFRKKELNDIIRDTHVQNLNLITCIEFPQNPSVIITSERMKNFIDQVEKDFDYIVYDSSSISTLKETVEIAKYMDEVMLVVRAGKTKLSELYSLQSLLNEKGIFDFDIILNDVKGSID